MDSDYSTVVTLTKAAKGNGGDCYVGGVFDKVYIPQAVSRDMSRNTPRQKFRLTLTVVPVSTCQ